MKTIILLIIGLTSLAGITYSQNQAKGPFKFKSGIIEYRYSGDKTGTAIHYIDDYGLKTAAYTEITSDGELTKSWVVSTGEYQYMWDPANPTQGMKMKNPLMNQIKQSSSGEIDALTLESYGKMGMKKNRNGKISW